MQSVQTLCGLPKISNHGSSDLKLMGSLHFSTSNPSVICGLQSSGELEEQVSLCITCPTTLSWAAAVSTKCFALQRDELMVTMHQGVPGCLRICTLLLLAFCLMHNLKCHV